MLYSKIPAQNDLFVSGWGDWGQTAQNHFDALDTPTVVNVGLDLFIITVFYGIFN
jgi:hypothetical protein